ncbi:hypothetical protein FN846DRAFT_934648 [Sphaerosporella brunnea]|uniref:Uncharacterized protein n=1 Tax=Sphaerosporella brunnea TaxID=1250544 RepID=A0A5J5F506_9PEZI|nr:hypothetical protein FN846DRAFT_934648 [Sphaerosporella brunnea]
MLDHLLRTRSHLQFPAKHHDLNLDVVGLLAVVGESAMAGHVQPATASHTCALPRFVPAPQSFLSTERPYRLPPNLGASVVGINSGNFSQTLNFFPDILHGIDDLPRFSVKTISITRAPEKPGEKLDGAPRSNITAKRYGPLNFLSIAGFLFWAGLLTEAAVLNDGMAVIAIILLGLTSSIVGYGSLWHVDLQRRRSDREVPPGDVVVLGRQAAFIVVRCPEDVARELYFGSERCAYVTSERVFQVLAASGTFLFMVSVIFLANCTWDIQASIGLAYIILNAMYWVAALMPKRTQWDLSAYVVTSGDPEFEQNTSYTTVLARVIKLTGETKWIRRVGAVPETNAWDLWLAEAQRNIDNHTWDGEKMLTTLMAAPSTIGFQPQENPGLDASHGMHIRKFRGLRKSRSRDSRGNSIGTPVSPVSPVSPV